MINGSRTLNRMMLSDKVDENGEILQPLQRQDSIRKVLPSVPGVDNRLNMSAKMINRRLSSSKGCRNYAPFIIEYSLLAEYNLLTKQKIPGVYMLPAAKTPLQWFGVIFVRQGLYQGGIFQFTMHIPYNFPDGDVPKIIFRPPVFHPLIKYGNGDLEVSRGFPKWRRSVNHLWQLMLYARQIFYKIDTSNPLNADAAKLFENDIEMFKHKVSKCNVKYKEHLYDVPESDDPHAIRFTEVSLQQYEEMKKSLLSFKSRSTTSSSNHNASCNGVTWVNPETLEVFDREQTGS